MVDAASRIGFGSRLIDTNIQHQLGGALERRWTATGLWVGTSETRGLALGLARARRRPSSPMPRHQRCVPDGTCRIRLGIK